MTLLLEFWLQYWPWIGFGALVAVLLALDLFVFHRQAHVPTLRESAGWTAFWCSLALVVQRLRLVVEGRRAGTEFLTGYLVEWTLSMDNVFVFAVIFRFFHVPMKYQYRVLFWGILGAIFMRLTFILVGAALINQFDWVLPIFGVFLVYTAIKLVTAHGAEVHPERNILMRLGRRLLRVSQGDHREHGRPFLRPRERAALHHAAVPRAAGRREHRRAVRRRQRAGHLRHHEGPVHRLHLEHLRHPGPAGLVLPAGRRHGHLPLSAYGLGAVLGFIGCGMIAEYIYELRMAEAGGEHGHLIPIWVKLAVIVAALGFAIGLSVAANRRDERERLNGVDPSHADSEDQPRG